MRRAPSKATSLDLQKNKETFHEAKASFDEPMQSGSQVPSSRGVPKQAPCGDSPEQIPQATTSGRCDEDESIGSVQSFLRSCLKLVRNERAIRELQRIIDQCQQPSLLSSAQRAIHTITGQTRTGREMKLTA